MSYKYIWVLVDLDRICVVYHDIWLPHDCHIIMCISKLGQWLSFKLNVFRFLQNCHRRAFLTVKGSALYSTIYTVQSYTLISYHPWCVSFWLIHGTIPCATIVFMHSVYLCIVSINWAADKNLENTVKTLVKTIQNSHIRKGGAGRRENYSFICLSICLSVCLSVCMLVCLYACLSVCLYVCLSVCRLPVCLSACLSVCLYVCLSVCMYAYLYACLSVCLPVCLSACLSVCMSACLSVCLFIDLSIYLFNDSLSNPFLMTYTK
jgi:hypothetical protein